MLMIQPQNEMCFCLSFTKQAEDPIHMSCQMKQKCKWIVQQLARKKEKQNKWKEWKAKIITPSIKSKPNKLERENL